MTNSHLVKSNFLNSLLATRRGQIGHLDSNSLKPLRETLMNPIKQSKLILSDIDKELAVL